MQITTFQKIESKLLNFILLPITLLVTIVLFFWTSFWDNYFLLATIIFTLSFAASFYFASINIIEKPLNFLIKIYDDNKKYKTIHKLNPETQSPQKSTNKISQTQSEELLLIQKSLSKKESERQTKRISFNPDSDQNIQSQNPPPITHIFSDSKPKRDTTKSQIKQPRLSKINSHQNPAKVTQNNHISNLFAFTNQKSQPLITKRKELSPKKQVDHYMDDFNQQEQSKDLRTHISDIFGTESNIEDQIRKQYQQRYQMYKKSLSKLYIDKQFMEKFVSQTKSVLKEKIQQHLKKQFENLDSIESIIKKNFDANFTSYKQRSTSFGAKSVYDFGPAKTYGKIHQEKSPFNKKEGFGSYNYVQEIKFSEVLQQCVNLMHTNYFEFEYTGEPTRINQIKNQLKILIKQRIELDKFLLLRKALNIERNTSKQDHIQDQVICEFEEQRYMALLKLQALAGILSQREVAQQNLLKQFFSRNTYSAQAIEQINDERNIEIVMNFYVRTVRQKLSDCGNEDVIKVQLSRPNFEDSSVNMIWIKRQNSSKSHYDILHSFKRDQNKSVMGEKEKTSDKDQKPFVINCCPGDTNLWTCISFVRLLISKIGLKKEKFPMIKDKQLRKEFTRIVELVK